MTPDALNVIGNKPKSNQNINTLCPCVRPCVVACDYDAVYGTVHA